MLKRNFNIVKKSVFALLVFIFIVFTIGIIPSIDPNNKNKIILSAASWKTDLAEITEVTDISSKEYIEINDLVSIVTDQLSDKYQLVTSVKDPSSLVNENTYITISDGLELYYFTEICNAVLADGLTPNEYFDEYLTYNYILSNDIDYEDASKTFKMLRPIGHEENYPFSGTFDGQGFTISNIFFRPFENENETVLYKEMFALSWFSQNSGTISNIGIINPNMIQYDIYENMVYATPFVGINKAGGTVENCYVQDLRGNTAGLSAEGGYDISMFAATNAGTIKNCYVATNRIHSSQVSITKQEQRHPFIFSNSGTITNCYFDSQIILGTYDTKTYDGLTALNTAGFNDNSFDAANVYHSNHTYYEETGNTEYGSYLNLKYPVLQGFNIDEDKYFLIEDVNDFVYMFNLINQYPPFRSAKYKLMSDIDLNMVDKDALVLSNSAFTGEFIGGEKVAEKTKYKVTLANDEESTNYAISNLNIEAGITNEGNHYYGLFSTVSGVVSNIDLINVNVQLNDYTDVIANTTKLVGTVCGKLEGGSIENVNVNAEIKVNENGNNTFLGKTYVGGICAYATGGKITGCTTNGTLVGGTYNPTSAAMDAELSSYYGGIVGRVDNNDGVINCLNSLDITAPTYTSTPGAQLRQYTGGVIGGGKLNNCTNLQNDGVITVGSLNTSAFYARPYIGGVVGRVESTSNANGVYFNNANINYYVTNNNLKAYISGVLNAISLTADKYDTFNGTGITAADVQSALDEEAKFEFTSLTNGGILNIENNVTSNTLKPSKYQAFDNGVTTGYDIRCAGVTYSYLTNMNVLGGYNLDTHYVRDNGAYTEVKNSAQSIDISMIDKYAPTFNADNQIAIVNNKVHLDTNYIRSNSDTVTTSVALYKTSINLERVYNYNDTHYITNNTVNAYTLNLSGCLNGFNMNLKNIRNDGDVKVYFTNTTHTNTKINTYLDYYGDYRKLKVYGVFEEVSLDHRAESVYNGGNITISSSTNVTPAFTMYIGGLCYKNIGNDKPGDSLMIPSGYKGSLHNSINAGTIRITSGDIIADTNNTITASGAIYGQSRIGGICAVNASTISQTFNIGDIYNINNVFNRDSNTYGEYSAGAFEVETGGFCFVQQNEVYNTNGDYTRGNIIDSANSGTIISMNVNNNVDSWTNAAGFVARNDRGEDAKLITDNDSSSVYAHLQKIQYSINYGDIIAYNADTSDNHTGNSIFGVNEQKSKAAGFVCLGACTVVDVINYGNIYGTRVASGLFGFIYFNRFTSTGASTSSPLYIANAINYGNVVTMNIGTNNVGKLYNVSDSTEFETTIYKTTSQNSTHYPVGALIGKVANGNLTILNVKNLVNFNENLDIVGAVEDTNTPSNQVRIETLQYMATVKDADYSPAPFSSDRNENTLVTYGIKSYSLDTRVGTHEGYKLWSKEYNGGIFNEDYTLRTAPALVDENGNIVTDPKEADPNNTDNFIADYIQFIPYSKVNDYLVSKIGLDEAVLAVSLENAANNYTIIQSLLVYFNNLTTEEKQDLNTVYDTLIKENYERLTNYKHSIVTSLSDYLKTCGNKEHVKEIFEVLMDDTESLVAASKSTLVSDIIKVIVNEMEDDVANGLISNLSEDELIAIINQHPEEFSAYVELLTNATNFSDPDSQLVFEAIKDIFASLMYDTDAVDSYVNSLGVEERKMLAKELYDWFSKNPNMEDIIVLTYPSIKINSEEDLYKLLNIVFTSNIIEEGEGTQESPNNVTESVEVAKSLTMNSKSPNIIYTKGEVTNIIDFSYTPDDALTDENEESGYITFEITDGTSYMTVVQCISLDGVMFTDQDQLSGGDFVVVSGYLYNNNNKTYEYAAGSTAISEERIYALREESEVKKSDYAGMYIELKSYTKTEQEILDWFNNKTADQIETLLKKFPENLNFNSTIFNFFDIGRKNRENIYLPATKYNYNAILNSDLSYLSSTTSGIDLTNVIYTGHYSNISGDTDLANLTEILIKQQEFHSIGNQAYSSVGGIYTDYHDTVVYWIKSTNNLFDFRASAHSPEFSNDYTYYSVYYPSSTYFEWPTVSTGVYGELITGEDASDTAEEEHKGIFDTYTSRYTASGYEFNNVDYYKFVDYGKEAVAPSKIDSDLTIGMVNSLYNMGVSGITDAESTVIIEHLQSFVRSAFAANTNDSLTPSIAAFAKLLFEEEFAEEIEDFDGNVKPFLLEQTGNYLKNINVSNSTAVLNNITVTETQKKIVNLFIEDPNYDFSLILSNLLQVLASNVTTSDENADGYEFFEKMLELHINAIKYGGPYVDKTDTLVRAISDIISSLTTEQKKELYGKISAVIGPSLLRAGYKDLSIDELVLIISQQLIYNINLLDNETVENNKTHYHSELKDIFDINEKSMIAAGIIAGDETLFKKYIFDSTPYYEAYNNGEYATENEAIKAAIEDFKDLMYVAGLDPDTVFDFAGIYALASSKGILNGLFLPDNIEMIGMDIYEETETGLVNDPTWRGGTVDNPNNYERDEETGKPINETINSRVFYEMKQLKQSIATVIFEMELVDGAMNANGEQSYGHAITNNLETDYFCNYKEYNTDGSYIIKNEVYFYVPINHDILTSDALYANMNAGSYELSYGATFDYTAKKDTDTEEPNKNLYIKLKDETLFVGRTLYDEFVIQAEDTSVKTTYTVYLVITAPSYLTGINSTVNGTTNVSFTEGTNLVISTGTNSEDILSAYIKDTNATNGYAVNGYNGNLHLTYVTKNLINGLSLLDNVNVYKTGLTTFSAIADFEFASYATTNNLLELDSEYTITGGTVVISGVTGTGYNNNFNTYDDGKVEFDIKLNNYLSKGLYLVEIKLNDDCVYYVLFEKAASTEANLINLTYNGQYFENSTNAANNEATPSTHPFGSPVTESFFKVNGQFPNDITIDSISGTLNANYFADKSVVCIYKKGNSNASSPTDSNRIVIKKNTINNKYYVSGMFSNGAPQPISSIDYDYLIVVSDSELFNKIYNRYKQNIDTAVEIETSGDNATVTFKEPIYLDSILTSPLSTFTVRNITVSQNNGLYTYAVEIIITAESGATNTFTHYITEEAYDTSLTTAYYNGAVVSITTEGTYIFVDEFEKYETPTYGFDFALDAFYVGDQEFRVAYCDLNGNEITDEEIKAVLEENTLVSVNQGQGFNITFKDSALSQNYYIKLIYENSVENFYDVTTTNATTALSWEVLFGTINIEKLKNKNSYLDNVTFISESVIASIKTLVDVKEFTETTYNTMMNSATREIVCLPGQIHYNKYAYDINKQAAFYVIGIVDKTDLSFYAPEFTLPDGASVYKIVIIGDETYKAVPYYTGTDIHTLTTFYVSEDNKTIIAPDGTTTITTEATSIETVTYNDVTYTLSPVAGKSSVEVGTEVVLNTTLYANYDEEGCFVEGATEGAGYFKYVDYRVYAEYYEEEQVSTYYTDYYVATQDLTNNIKFNIEIVKNSGVDDSHAAIYNAYVEFVCYTLGEGKSADKRENYELYNRAGVFGKFDQTGENLLIASNPSLHSNTSGYYQVNVSLPEGYSYTVTLTDRRANNGDPKEYAAGEEIFIVSSLTARTVSIKVTIIKSTNTDNSDWGQTGTNDSFYVPSQEETN